MKRPRPQPVHHRGRDRRRHRRADRRVVQPASWLAQRFHEGERVAFAGRVRDRLRPEADEDARSSRSSASRGRRRARPHASSRSTAPPRALSTNWIRRLVAEALDAYGDVPDFLPAALRLRRDLPPLADALRAGPLPRRRCREAEEARRRLAYEELLALQLGLAMRRHALVESVAGLRAHASTVPRSRALRAALPFALTGDQERATCRDPRGHGLGAPDEPHAARRRRHAARRRSRRSRWPRRPTAAGRRR